MAGKKKGGGKGRAAFPLRRLAGIVSLAFAAIVVLGVGILIGSRLGGDREPPPPPAMTRPLPRPSPPPQPPAPPRVEPPQVEPPRVELPPPAVEPPPVIVTQPAPPPAALPPWRKNAVAAPEIAGRPMIAIVIDDLGVDRRHSDRIVALPGPLTTAFMSYAKDLPRQTAVARARGHELLLHMPMEPQDGSYDPGPDVLEVGLPPAEIRRRLALGLDRFEGMIGLNNHMGSKFTENPAGMAVVMEELHRRGLVFLDSLTSGRSVGRASARQHGVPAVGRDVFLDNEETLAHVRAQLDRTERLARKQGHAVAIGHPYGVTVEALAQWLPTLPGKGLVLVPLSAIIKREMPAG